jgi:hypothetical protein
MELSDHEIKQYYTPKDFKMGVYHIFEFISNEPNKKIVINPYKLIPNKFFSCPKNILTDNNRF